MATTKQNDWLRRVLEIVLETASPRPAGAYADAETFGAGQPRPATAYSAPDMDAEDPPRPAAAYSDPDTEVARPVRPSRRPAPVAPSVAVADAAGSEPPASPPAPPAAPVAAPRPPPMTRFDPARASFGRYIKSGAFGVVSWLDTTQPGAGPLVIKVPGDEDARVELEHEAATYAKVPDHPNVVKCWGMQEVEGRRGLVLEGIKGRDMAGAMGRLEQLRTADSATLGALGLPKQLSQENFVGTLQYMMAQTLQGLVHLEQNGVIHNDIRPDNVMCDATTGEVKIVDFGLTKAVGDTTRGKAPFKHGSVAPEFTGMPGAPRAPLTGKHDVFGAGEIARKGMERDQFRYLTGKAQKDLSPEDAHAFGLPDAEGNAKRSLASLPHLDEPEPELLDERVAKVEARVAALYADPGFAANPHAATLARAVPDAQAALESVQTLAEAENIVLELEAVASAAEARHEAATTKPEERDPFAHWEDVRARIGTLGADRFIAGTPAAAELEKLSRSMLQIWNDRGSLTLPEIDAAVAKAERQVRNYETRLKRAGQTRAETSYTAFVNWAMNPDPAQRPSAAEALQHPFLTDRLLDDEAAQSVLKMVLALDPPVGSPPGGESDTDSASASDSDSDSWSSPAGTPIPSFPGSNVESAPGSDQGSVGSA